MVLVPGLTGSDPFQVFLIVVAVAVFSVTTLFVMVTGTVVAIAAAAAVDICVKETATVCGVADKRFNDNRGTSSSENLIHDPNNFKPFVIVAFIDPTMSFQVILLVNPLLFVVFFLYVPVRIFLRLSTAAAIGIATGFVIHFEVVEVVRARSTVETIGV